VPAYLPIEKLSIARQYLIPQIEQEYGFKIEQKAEEAPAEKPKRGRPKKKEPKVEEVVSSERVTLTDASIMEIIGSYCGYEAGVRNLRKAIDRVFRKIVAKLENQTSVPAPASMPETIEYQINSKNLELFLDIPSTDDTYFQNINKQQPIGSSNGLAYVNDGYGSVLKI